MLKYLKELCLLSGPSSFEAPVRAFIEQKAKKYADSVRTDTLGNLIVYKKGNKTGGPKLVLTAHMDEVGFIVRKIEDNGLLKIAPVGGIDRRVAIGRKVLVGEKQIPGVVGLKAIHLTTAEERKNAPKISEMYVDIGAADAAEAKEQTCIGDYAVFESDCIDFGSGCVKAKAIDDRVGCAVMLNLLEEELPMDVSFVFSVMEEVGCRGAFGAAFSEKPDLALVLEGTTAADLPTVAEGKKVTRLGNGPVLGRMDRGTIYDNGLFETLRGLAEENGIPWQIKEYISGGTDAQAIQRSREGVRVACISAPIRYLHASACVANKKDIDNCLKLARLFVKKISEGL